jgi:hypothetical protein
VTTIGLAEKDGIRITFPSFVRFGVVVAAGTLVIASAYLAAYVYLGKWRVFTLGLMVFAGLLLVRAAWRRLRDAAQ